jgi:predicted MFS family arabinose efflux permease
MSREYVERCALAVRCITERTPRGRAQAIETDRPSSASAWAPLGDPRFRVAWLAFLGAQVVIWAQTVGAVDVITGRSGSAAVVAAIQTAISLPGVILALFAGAVADVVDRRRLLLGACLSMTAAMVTLAALTVADAASPAAVLVLTAALGSGLAMFLPAFSATVPQLVPRALLAPAMAITGVSVNIARAAGPALAGVLIAVAGAGGLFWVLSGVLLAVVGTLAVAGPPSSVPERPERLGAAVRAGARFARFSAPLRTVIARTGLFVVFGSALFAILPLIAVRRLDLGASGFGLLLGAFGVGAVAGALVLPRLQERLPHDLLITACGVVLAAVLAALTVVTAPLVAGAVLLLAGAAWIAVLTAFMTAAQVVTPAWVRGRAFATWILAYQGGLALGSLAWGFVAEASLSAALLVPAAGLVAGALATRLLPLPGDDHGELEPTGSWADPVVARELADDDGPVLVTVEYEVDEADADAFVAAMDELSAIRRRDGAVRWDLFHDVAEPGRFLETFTVATWGEHLLQHERGTQVDLPLEERAAALTRGYTVRHFFGPARRGR